jgi:outer membrane protein assembly factor BamB
MRLGNSYLWTLTLVATCVATLGCNQAENTTGNEPAPAGESVETSGSDETEPASDETEPASDETEPASVEAEPASVEAEPMPAEPEADATGEKVVTGDWTMWGGSAARNMVNATTPLNIDFDPEDGTHVLWESKLGSQSYGNPVVSGGKVFVGTNNGGGYRPKHPSDQDRGVLLCFDEKSGEFLWQLTREKLAQGRVNDWPLQGICSSPVVEGDRLYVVTNRCELMCVDAEGFLDGENDGPVTDEVDNEKEDADIIWSLDMIEDLGVFPHNLATSSPVIYEDMIYIVTSNGVDEAHLEIPSPRAPCFLAVNKNTGEVVWEDNTPFDTILHGQWGSPAIGVVDGQAQVYMPGGDGWLYAMDAKSGEHIWKFDLNPKDTKWELGGRGSRNAIISTPVFYENSVILAVGQDPEHGEGVGHLYRIDATKKGDISAQLGEIGSEGEPNPNSGQIWHYGGADEDGSVTGKEGSDIFRRTISTVAVAGGLVIAPDLSGRIHCVDAETGKRYWEADLLAATWGSPMVADGKIFIGDEDGELTIFKLSQELEPIREEVLFKSSIYSTPTIANGVMYVADRSTLYAIKIVD